MAFTARLATRLTPAVDRRLRMYSLTGLLDQALPPADGLASALSQQPDAEAVA